MSSGTTSKVYSPIVAENDLTKSQALVAAAISSGGIAACITNIGVVIDNPTPNDVSASRPD
jgi:hypothetical protein